MRRTRKAVLALAGTTVLWGSTFVLIRELVKPDGGANPLPPFLLLTLRFAVGTVVLFLAMRAKRGRMTREAWRRGFVLGVLTCGGFAFQTIGLQYTTSARSAFITNTSLLMIPFFGIAVGKPWPRALTWLGLLLALGGLWLLEFPVEGLGGGATAPAAETLYKGDAITLGCAVLFAMQILATEAYSPKTSLLPLVFAQFLSCAACGAAASAISGEWSAPMPAADRRLPAAASILYLGVVCTAGCLLIMAWAQRFTTATQAAMIFTLEPIIAALLAWYVLSENLTPSQWIGCAVVVGGILVAEALGAPSPPHEDAMRPLAPAVFDEEVRE